MIIALCVVAAVAVVTWGALERGWVLPRVKGLPVLLYHQITTATPGNLAVHAQEFERQLRYLKEHRFVCVTIAQVIEAIGGRGTLPHNPVLITFDDGYVNNRDLALPLLRKYGMRATLFLPAAFLGGTNQWDRGSQSLLSAEQLKDPVMTGVFEYGLHGHAHRFYGAMSTDEIDHDVRTCIVTMREAEIPFVPALAYPYGGRPKDPAAYAVMIATLKDAGIVLALRIGNRVNRLPVRDRYEMKRIDIRGTDSLRTFGIKVKKGRMRMF